MLFLSFLYFVVMLHIPTRLNWGLEKRWGRKQKRSAYTMRKWGGHTRQSVEVMPANFVAEIFKIRNFFIRRGKYMVNRQNSPRQNSPRQKSPKLQNSPRQNSPRQNSPKKTDKTVPDKTVPLKALVIQIKKKVQLWSSKKALKSENQNHRGAVVSALGSHSEVAGSSPSGEKYFRKNQKLRLNKIENWEKLGKVLKSGEPGHGLSWEKGKWKASSWSTFCNNQIASSVTFKLKKFW